MFNRLKNDSDANVSMDAIGVVVGVLVTIIIAVLVFYSIAGSIDTSDLDSTVEGVRAGGNTTSGTPVTNSTDAVLDQAATVFTIMPIIAIVIVAVIILLFIGKIGG